MYTILQQRGNTFKAQVIVLKKRGAKTEATFAQLPGIHGDPYTAILTFVP